MTTPSTLALALEHHRAGRFEQAEANYRQVLQTEPACADALHWLGVLALQRGQPLQAIEFMGRAVELHPDQAAYHSNFGEAYRGLGRLSEALACYERALRCQPDLVEAHNNRGNALKSLGRVPEALDSYRRALEIKSDFVDALFNLASTLHEQGQFSEAIARYRQVLDLMHAAPPGDANQQQILVALHAQLGSALKDQGRLNEAIPHLEQALQWAPDPFEAHHNLGHALQLQGHLARAAACYERALQIRPDCVAPRVNLAGLRRLEGRLEEAAKGCQIALQYQPDCAEAYSTLGAILQAQSRLEEALAAMERAVALKPGSAALHSSFLGTLHYCPDITLERLYEAHQEYERRHAARWRAAWPEHRHSHAPDRPLRVGFVSPHFAGHPVGYFMIRALEHLDRRDWQVVCYSDTIPVDDLTGRFQAAACLWREMVGKTDEELARQIQADAVDILFDLAGHTGGNRLLAFARKPAPVQITWLDYEGTTGLGGMDYLLADRYVVPPESERWYAEKILRMPDGFVCYEPPAGAPAVGPLPAQVCGRVTLGSFNLLGKITPEVVATWARILHRLPDSRLMIKYHGLDDSPTRVRFEQQFAGQGIAGERLLLEGWSPYAEFLKRYQEIDIALDPFPYTGGLTTCEALWMGVPVVTCPGEIFASRHGLSHLSNIGLSETIARDKEHYVELTAELAGDLSRLARIRAGLRQQMASSPLCDGRRFATNLMTLLRDVWRQWIAGPANSRG